MTSYYQSIIDEIENAYDLKTDQVIAKNDTCETLADHVSAMLELWNQFYNSDLGRNSGISDEEDMLVRLAARHHDDGKASCIFKRWMSEQNGGDYNIPDHLNCLIKGDGKTPHNFLSPAWLPWNVISKRLTKSQLFVLLNAIFYHHSRSLASRDEIASVVNIDRQLGASVSTAYLNGSNLMSGYQVSMQDWRLYAKVKGFLNRLDIAASSHSPCMVETLHPSEPSLAELIDGKINPYDHQISMASRNTENIVIVGPTGSGKTEAALMWAGRNRLYYILPKGAHISPIYQRIRNTYNFSHVGCTYDLTMPVSYAFDEGKSALDYNRTNRFAMITTTDYAFDFCDKRFGSEIMFADLVSSRVIVDEIQACDAKGVARVIYGLKVLQDYGGKFSIITSTLPSSIIWFMKQMGLKASINAFRNISGLANDRHVVQICHGMIDPKIIASDKRSRILVVCNTLSQAQVIYSELDRLTRGFAEVRMLSCAHRFKDRALLEAALENDVAFRRPNYNFHNTKAERNDVYDAYDNLRKYSFEHKQIFWITDRSIEVASDISFDALYTESAPADVLIQRMGRVNRYGESDCGSDVRSPNVYIFNMGSGMADVYNHNLCCAALSWLSQYISSIHPFFENEKQAMVADIYSPNRTKGTKWWKILESELSVLQSSTPWYGIRGRTKDPEDMVCVIDSEAVSRLKYEGLWDKIVCAESPDDPILYTGLLPWCSRLPRRMVSPNAPRLLHKRYGAESPTCRIVNMQYHFDPSSLKGVGLVR